MDPDLDLLEHYKLDAIQSNGFVVHTSYISDCLQNVRKLETEEGWVDDKLVGQDLSGEVRLQERKDPSPPAWRAVKVLR